MPKAKQVKQRATLIFLLIITSVIAVDQVTKLWAKNNLSAGNPLPLTSFLQLSYGENTGALFGLFPGQSFLLTVVGLAGLLAVLLAYRHLPQGNTVSFLALGLLLGGAIGNLIDRISMGYVIDFIDFHLGDFFHWPAFNFADSAITVGVFIFVCYCLSIYLGGKRGSITKV